MIRTYDAAYTPPQGPGIVLVGGCFDVLHYGHVVFLKQAKALGSTLVVALENDGVIEGSKKRTPFHSHDQRALILDALTMVDEVLLLPTMSTFEAYLDLVRHIQPQVIAFTAGDPQADNKTRQAHLIGAHARAIPFEKGFSTTALLEKYQGL